jgi:hypothetical protein
MKNMFFPEHFISASLCYREHMRIFVKPSKDERAVSSIAQEAFDALRSAGITSARIGGIVNDQGVVLVDGADCAFALTMLARAGFTAVADSR